MCRSRPEHPVISAYQESTSSDSRRAVLDTESGKGRPLHVFFRKMITTATGRIKRSIVLRTWLGIFSTIDAAMPEPIKELKAASSDDSCSRLQLSRI